MANFLIKSVDRSNNGFDKVVDGQLKQGDSYCWFDVLKKKITHEGLIYDPMYHKPFQGRYIKEINNQISKGIIYINN